MAAQERAKQAAPSPAAAAPDLLDDAAAAAPPAFDATALPPQAPPPAFDDSLMPPPPAAAAAPPMMQWDPHAPPPAVAMDMPPAASAPDIGDLLSHEAPLPTTAAVPPPPQQSSEQEDAIEAILGLEGLSAAEKQELIDEQLKIMASIEKNKDANKNSAAHSAADAFESRSFSAAVSSIGGTTSGGTGGSQVRLGTGRNAILHGPERSQQAIQQGTALSVQCISCQHWMQVTADATLMNCPVCSTVQPVAHDAQEAAQLQSDAELAEQLQKEEYQQEEERERRQREKRSQPASNSSGQAGQEKEQGWLEWMGLSGSTSPTTTSPERPMSFAQAPVHRGEVGVSRPPGAGGGSRLHAPTTGQEIGHAPSYDSSDGLLEQQRQSARVAEPQPLFSCVADSISTALNTAMTGPPPDGVDSSSLLAMPAVRREEKKDHSPY